MLAGGISEAIMHFAGYLNIFDDIARDRLEYDGNFRSSRPEDYVAAHPVYSVTLQSLDIETSGTPRPAPINLDDLRLWHHLPTRLHGAWSVELPDEGSPTRLSPLPTYLVGAGSVGGGAVSTDDTRIRISVTYQADGEQTLLDVHQHNFLSNNDIIGDGEVVGSAAAINAAAEISLQQMADAANAEIPQAWWIPQNSSGASAFLADHDQAWAAGGGAPDAHSVEPGYYLNGVLQDPAPAAPYESALADPPAGSDLGSQIGQWADLGSNFSVNAALVIDVGESGRTMIVEGDYFSTNAIFQTNSMVDENHLSTTDSSVPAPLGGGDTLDSIADFVEHPGIHASLPAYFAGPNWSVDVVDGDYYSVHTVVQTNYLSDNDVIGQQSTNTHYEIHAGGNVLENLTQILDGDVHYDLIIVAGAYHGMNVIFQNNILLTTNDIKMIADGVDASQSASGGHNALTNEATIESYGGDNFQDMNGDAETVVTAISSGAVDLDPEYGTYFDGSGGTIHVLYVMGDYYDINAVWQTNVTSDVNVMAQLTGAPAEGLAQSLGQDGSVTQSVVAGHNSLTNDAAIIDVGPTNTIVGGQVYNDAVLVQANLLPDEESPMLAGDTHTLVPELIAFVTDSQDVSHTESAPTTTLPAPHEDPMASVMH